MEAGFQMSFWGYTVTYEILAAKSVLADVPAILKLFALKYCEFVVNQSHMIYSLQSHNLIHRKHVN